MNAKPRLLCVVHCYNNKAGVEEHVKVLAQGLRESYEVFITFPEDGVLVLLQPGQSPRTFPAERLGFVAPHRSAAMEESFNTIVEAANPDIIHIVHFANWPFGLIDVALATGRPVVASFHDYYAITPHFTMQNETDALQTTSSSYAKRIFGRDISSYLVGRREVIQNSIARLSARIVPSTYLLKQLSRVFSYEYKIIEYGIVPFSIDRTPKADGKFRFAYLGTRIPQKGWESLIEAFQKVHRQFPNATLNVHGGGPTVSPIPGVEFHNPYDQDQIPGILANVDIGIIPSIFAETFSIVLSEMWQAGVLAAVSDIGAMGDRVIDGVNGKKFRPGDVDSIAETLCWFLQHDEWRTWKIPKPPLADEMCRRYSAVYQAAILKK